MAALPFCESGVRAVLKAPKPKEQPVYGEGLSGMLLRRRHDLSLTSKQAADTMGVNWWTYMTWESKGREPTCTWYPEIIAFLGREPWPEPVSLPEQLRAARLRRGLSIKVAAEGLGVDEGTFGRWESGAWKPQARSLPIIELFLRG